MIWHFLIPLGVVLALIPLLLRFMAVGESQKRKNTVYGVKLACILGVFPVVVAVFSYDFWK